MEKFRQFLNLFALGLFYLVHFPYIPMTRKKNSFVLSHLFLEVISLLWVIFSSFASYSMTKVLASRIHQLVDFSNGSATIVAYGVSGRHWYWVN